MHSCSFVVKDTFPWSKPDPRALLSTIEMAGGRTHRAVMVGDSRTDIDAAKAAGIPVIAVDFGYSDVPCSELGADACISGFGELRASIDQLFAPDQRLP